MAELTSRERWLTVLKGEIPDRVPMDYAATPELTQKLMAHLGTPDQEALFARLHVDSPFGVGPRYQGPPLPAGTDMYGCRFVDMDYGAGAYEECVFSPLARFETPEQIAEGYSWPSADWFDFSVIPGQLARTQDRPTILGMAGIYTLYTRLRGLEQAFIDFAVNHELVLYCLDCLVDLHYEIALRSIEAARGKIDIGSIANDLGSQLDLLFSPGTMRKLFLPGIRRLAGLAHQNGMTVHLHSDGAIRKAIPDLIEAGVEILDPVQWRCQGMERERLKADFGDRLVFHGAVDNQYTLFQGTLDEVREEVKYNIDTLGAGGGYILAPCHALQTVSSPEVVVAMYETGYEYGRY